MVSLGSESRSFLFLTDEKKKRRHKSKHHKHGKHKKEKRNKKDPDENADLGLDLPEIDPEPHFSP